MKKQPEIHSRKKYFEALCGQKQKDRSKARQRKKAKK